MAVTTEQVEAQLQRLINSANATTGNSDTNLNDGVSALIAGYGQGSNSGGGNSEGDIDGMYSVSFICNGKEIARNYVLHGNGTIFPTDKNGRGFVYSPNENEDLETVTEMAEFPYFPSENTTLYAMLCNVKLPSPFKSYLIYYNTSTWKLYLFKTTSLEIPASDIASGGFMGEQEMYIREFNTIEEAVNELVAIHQSQTVSSDYISVKAVAIYTWLTNYEYYLSHDIYGRYEELAIEKKPYIGQLIYDL